MKNLRDADVNNKVVLVRVDYNVPMKDGEITSDLRIRASIPTLKYLKENGAKKIILISHLGRPEGKEDSSLSLEPVSRELSKVLEEEKIDIEVKFVSENVGEKVKTVVSDSNDGEIILLENLRFSPREEENSMEFAREIIESTGAELFIQDGFAVVHRAHASTDAIAKLLPSFSGFLVEKEVNSLKSAIDNPEHPVMVIVGGAKVEDKEPLIKKFLPIADKIFVGGKIAVDGYNPESEKICVAEDFAMDENGEKLDIGTESTKHILEAIHGARTIVWNGVVGFVEKYPFDMASKTIARAIGHREGVNSIICGGDTAGFVEALIEKEPNLRYSLISTGGGASLELLSGIELPGLKALE